MGYVGRFAPSPTGAMHLGLARTMLAAWLDARSAHGRILMRVEDIDRPRVASGSERGLLFDLEWLGLDWDGQWVRQSEREELYAAAVAQLESIGRVFSCCCSRKEIGEASAPHGGGEPIYPGTCRDGPVRADRPLAQRLRTQPGDVESFTDRLAGVITENVHETVGDFVIRRSDRLWAYQLAVTVDDLAQGVTSIVRGRDLLASTARQMLLRRLLDPNAPRLETLHVPLLLDAAGKKLSKRDGSMSVGQKRESGESSRSVVGTLAASLGLVDELTEITPAELIPLWRVDRLHKEDRMIPEA
ncbi:MAG: tRNA glutamyl-Q(34) synthetase GluQRS [Deltaproteobacteria bacterium]|nr:tRNA glutamyl-Q(34) synthetase GluQRS [Deltaproteobacteria bacterium]